MEIGRDRKMEELLKEVEQRLNDLIYADDECRKTALAKHNFDSVKYFQQGIFFTERAKSVVLEIINAHM